MPYPILSSGPDAHDRINAPTWGAIHDLAPALEWRDALPDETREGVERLARALAAYATGTDRETVDEFVRDRQATGDMQGMSDREQAIWRWYLYGIITAAGTERLDHFEPETA